MVEIMPVSYFARGTEQVVLQGDYKGTTDQVQRMHRILKAIIRESGRIRAEITVDGEQLLYRLSVPRSLEGYNRYVERLKHALNQ